MDASKKFLIDLILKMTDEEAKTALAEWKRLLEEQENGTKKEALP